MSDYSEQHSLPPWDESKTDYSQGVCHDGAVILKNGEPMTPEQIVSELKAAQRQGGEAVACPGCDNELEGRDHPEGLCDDCKITRSKNAIPQPAVPGSDWIACSERLPTEADADPNENVWAYNKKKGCVQLVTLYSLTSYAGTIYSHWKSTNLKRPEPPEDQ